MTAFAPRLVAASVKRARASSRDCISCFVSPFNSPPTRDFKPAKLGTNIA
jgi:hypothetical protein